MQAAAPYLLLDEGDMILDHDEQYHSIDNEWQTVRIEHVGRDYDPVFHNPIRRKNDAFHPATREAFRQGRKIQRLQSAEIAHDSERYVQAVKCLWDILGNVPVTGEEIDAYFVRFHPGTPKEEVWTWFEKELDISVAYLMGHDVHPVTGNSLQHT